MEQNSYILCLHCSVFWFIQYSMFSTTLYFEIHYGSEQLENRISKIKLDSECEIKRASKFTQRKAQAKRAKRSKSTSERCDQMSEQSKSTSERCDEMSDRSKNTGERLIQMSERSKSTSERCDQMSERTSE